MEQFQIVINNKNRYIINNNSFYENLKNNKSNIRINYTNSINENLKNNFPKLLLPENIEKIKEEFLPLYIQKRKLDQKAIR